MHKIALIGAGRIGRIHGANVVAHPGLALSHVVDPIAESAAAAARAFDAEISDFDAVLADPSVAGVVVASSTDTHLDYSVRAHAAGKAVFCEKPLDMDLARARAAADSLKGARLFLGFNRRFDPNFRALKAALDAGRVGGLESLQITSNDPSPPPVSYVKVSGACSRTWRSTTLTWPAGSWARSPRRCSPGAVAWSIPASARPATWTRRGHSFGPHRAGSA